MTYRNLSIFNYFVKAMIFYITFVKSALNRFKIVQPLKSKKMKIKFGAIVTDGRGKLGGHVFSKNASGAYMRTKVTPTNPQTSDQTTVRALFAVISQTWSTLTAGQITAWNSAVADWVKTNIFGDIKKPTGKALFQQLNNQAMSVGYSALTTPPAKVELPDDVLSDVVLDISSTTLTLTGASTASTSKVAVYASGIVTDGTTNVKSKMRLVYYAAGDVYSNTAAYAAYVAKFGAPTAGAKLFVGVKYIASTGQATPLQTIQATIQA